MDGAETGCDTEGCRMALLLDQEFPRELLIITESPRGLPLVANFPAPPSDREEERRGRLPSIPEAILIPMTSRGGRSHSARTRGA